MSLIDERPTLELIEEFVTKYEEVWGEAHRKFDELDSYYHRTYPLWPESLKHRPSYHSSKATNIVDHAADTQLPSEPVIKRFPSDPDSQESKEKADKVERFLQAVFDDSALFEPAMPFKQAGKNLIHYGYAVMSGPWWVANERDKPKKSDGEEQEDYERRLTIWENSQKERNPFRYKTPHPASVLLDPRDKQPLVAVSTYNKFAYDLLNLYTKRTSFGDVEGNEDVMQKIRSADPYADLKCKEMFSDSWRAIVVDDYGLLFAEPNVMMYNPFLHGFSGWGQEVTSPATPGLNPKYLAKGMLEPVLDSIKRKDQAMTAQMEILVKNAFIKRGTTKDPKEAQQELDSDIITGRETDWWWEKMPQLNADLFRTTGDLDRDIEEGTFSAALSGFREEGVTTVGQQVILSGAAQNKFKTITKQMNYFGTIMASRILRLIEIYGEDITVRGHSISPSDVEGNYYVRVEFNLTDPVLHQQQLEQAQWEFTNKLIGPTEYYEMARKEDATGIMDSVDEHEAMQLPLVKQFVQAQILRKRGFKELADRMEQQVADQITQEQPSGLVLPNSPNSPSQRPFGPGEAANPAAALQAFDRGLNGASQ